MYGKIENGKLNYHNGKAISIENGVIVMPTIETLNAHGIYEIVNVQGNGEDKVKNGKIMHYICEVVANTEWLK